MKCTPQLRQLPLLTALILAAHFALAADPARPADNADTATSYRYLRALRAEAQGLSKPGASPGDLQSAVVKYQAALDYLATPPVAERAAGDEAMLAENINLRIPLADAYARLGMKEQALAALERTAAAVWLPQLDGLLAQPAFDGIRDEPRFKALQRTMKLPQRLYQVPAIATPYKPVLTVEEKVAGLSLFWAEARRNFVYFDHVPELAWDQVYMDYLSKVIAAPTTRDYYRVMMQLAPLLQDGHTNIYPPQELAGEFYSRPPLRTVLVEDKVLVERAGDGSKVHAGDEIIAIDGEPVRSYAEQRVAPFVSASTPQDRLMRMYSYQLLGGDAAKPVTLHLRGADGAERDETVERKGGVQGQAPFAFRMLPGQIAYLSLDHFESPEGVQAFELVLPEILKARGLVLDVRRNGGGSSEYGQRILSYLSKDPVRGTLSTMRTDDVVMRAQAGPQVRWSPTVGSGKPYVARHDQVYTGPVAVLTGAQTFSAAEDFTAMFKIMKRGVIVGEATGGSTGHPLFFNLPGGGKARICVKRDVYPDGTTFVGKGIAPDVEVRETVAALRAGRDLVLERAGAELAKAAGQ